MLRLMDEEQHKL